MGRLFIFSIFFISTVTGWTSNLHLAKEIGRKSSGDFNLVKVLVDSNNLKSPLEFLETWQALRSEYFENYVLAYRSRSLQQSDFLHPRALIFNSNADLVMAYNGHPRHEGYDVIEMMRFNHQAKSFEFYEMSFENNLAKLSKPNPGKCLACHQSASRKNQDPRPNWEPYNIWPGFYGSIDDATDQRKNTVHTLNRLLGKGDDFLLREMNIETEKFYQFKSSTLIENPRYSLLSEQTIDQYKKERTLNGDLTNRLGVLNFQRVARLFRTTSPELYQMVKWTIYGHAMCSQRVFMDKESVRWLYEKVEGLDQQRFFEKAAELDNKKPNFYGYGDPSKTHGSASYTPPTSDYYFVRNTHLINILFEAFGISTEDWSMDFKTQGGRFSAFERFGVTNEPLPPWRYAIRFEFEENDPDFIGAEKLSCDEIEEKSLNTFKDFESTKAIWESFKALRDRAPQPPLIQQCIQCHVDENYGLLPFIPFDDPQQLATQLVSSGYKRGTLYEEIMFRLGPHATKREQMPRGFVPTEESRQGLIEYLDSLRN